MTAPTVRVVASDVRQGSFAPFVPAVGLDGAAVFTATEASGKRAIWRANGDQSRVLVTPDGSADSHPATDRAGRVCFFSGMRLCRWEKQSTERLTGPELEVGPLGPTTNASGSIAFRARTESAPGIWLWHDGLSSPVAEVGDHFAEFRGLPCVDDRNRVAFRAADNDGREGLYRWDRGSISTLLVAERDISELGDFIATNPAGAIALGGRLGGAGATVLLVDDDGLTPMHVGEFDRVRGALLDAAGRLTIIAYRNGLLGLHGADGEGGPASPLLAVGERVAGRAIAELALNAVSKNAQGQLAVRLGYRDGGESIALLSES